MPKPIDLIRPFRRSASLCLQMVACALICSGQWDGDFIVHLHAYYTGTLDFRAGGLRSPRHCPGGLSPSPICVSHHCSIALRF
jgi:hypothetical protein